MGEGHRNQGTVMFGYDPELGMAFLGLLHAEDGIPPHLDSQFFFSWEDMPMLVERMSVLFQEVNPTVEIFKRLCRPGERAKEAWEAAQIAAEREREIGET